MGRLLHGLIRCAVALVVAGAACSAAAAPVRKNILSLTPAEVATLRQGVAAMQARDPAPGAPPQYDDPVYRTSWDFWARIHGAPRPLPAHAVPQRTFDRCDHGTVFLAWHRVYLHYFERTLQKAAGSPDLKIPYWNYTSGPNRSRPLPAIFRDKTFVPSPGGAPVANPLYKALRAAGIHSGQPLANAVTSTLAALGESDFDLFQETLFATPHGNVHCALVTGSCPSPLMGTPVRAAEDPIFWPHHTNMDRLWNCWRKLHQQTGGRSANIQSPRAPFVFADENGALTAPLSAQQLVEFAETLDVEYEEEDDCAEAPVSVPSPIAAAGQAHVLGASDTATPVGSDGAKVTLPISAPAAAAAEVLSAPKRIVLIVSLTRDGDPSGLYAVRVRRTDTGAVEEVGTVSFFGGEHAAHHAGPEERRYDVTRMFATSGVPGSAQVEIELVPTTGLGDEPAGTGAALSVEDPAGLQIKALRMLLER